MGIFFSFLDKPDFIISVSLAFESHLRLKECPICHEKEMFIIFGEPVTYPPPNDFYMVLYRCTINNHRFTGKYDHIRDPEHIQLWDSDKRPPWDQVDLKPKPEESII